MTRLLWDNLFTYDKEKKDIVSVLQNCYLFDDLNRRELKFVSELVHPRYFKPGEVVFQEGDTGIGMYIIVRGTVNIMVNNRYASNDEKKDLFVTRLKKGDFFGEISFAEDNGKRTASAIAHEDLLVIGFFKPDLDEIIERNPSTGVKIIGRLLKVLGRRLRETALKVSELKQELKQLV
jgi:CRP-like cAMP-binding protein